MELGYAVNPLTEQDVFGNPPRKTKGNYHIIGSALDIEAIVAKIADIPRQMVDLKIEECPMVMYTRGAKKKGGFPGFKYLYDPYYGEHIIQDRNMPISGYNDDEEFDDDDGFRNPFKPAKVVHEPEPINGLLPYAINREFASRKGDRTTRNIYQEVQVKMERKSGRHTFYACVGSSLNGAVKIVRMYEFNLNVPCFPLVKRAANESTRFIITMDQGNWKLFYNRKTEKWEVHKVKGRMESYLRTFKTKASFRTIDRQDQHDDLDNLPGFSFLPEDNKGFTYTGPYGCIFEDILAWTSEIPLTATKRPYTNVPSVSKTNIKYNHFEEVEGGVVLRTFYSQSKYEMARLYVLKGRKPFITRVCPDGSEYISQIPRQWRDEEITIRDNMLDSVPRMGAVAHMAQSKKPMRVTDVAAIIMFPALEKLAYAIDYPTIKELIESLNAGKKQTFERYLASKFNNNMSTKEVFGYSSKQMTSFLEFVEKTNKKDEKRRTFVTSLHYMATWRKHFPVLDSTYGKDLYYVVHVLGYLDDGIMDMLRPYGTRFVHYAARLGVILPEDCGYDTRYEMIQGWLTFVKSFRYAGIVPTEQDLFTHPKEIRREKKKLEEIAKAQEGQNFIRSLQAYKDLEWENDEYLIRIPRDAAELRREGNALGHCVGGYTQNIITGRNKILFMRRKHNPEKPFLTIDVSTRKTPEGDTLLTLEQAFMFSNMYPPKEVENAIGAWCRKLGIKPDALNHHYSGIDTFNDDSIKEQEEYEKKIQLKKEQILEIIRSHKPNDEESVLEKARRLPTINKYNYREAQDILVELGYMTA